MYTCACIIRMSSYRTLKLRISGSEPDPQGVIHSLFPALQTEASEGWVSILVDEEQTSVMNVLTTLQQSMKIRDVQIEEISTEDVIRKIYEGDMQ